MPKNSPSPVYLALLKRLSGVTLDQTFISTAAISLMMLQSVNKETFDRLSHAFLRKDTRKHIMAPAGISVLKAYASTPNLDDLSTVKKVIQCLQQYRDSMSSKDISELFGAVANIPLEAKDARSLMKVFLPAALEKCTETDPLNFSRLILALSRLNAKQTITKLLQHVPKVFALATVRELCFLIFFLKVIHVPPADAGTFLWNKLSQHPERSTITPGDAQKVLFALGAVSPTKREIEWLLNSLTGHLSEFPVKNAHRILYHVSLTQHLKSHPIVQEIYRAIRAKRTELPIRRVLSIVCIMKRFPVTLHAYRTTGVLLDALLENFHKLPARNYLQLLEYLVGTSGHLKLKRNFYHKFEIFLESMTRDAKAQASKKAEQPISKTAEKCSILRLVVELRRVVAAKSDLKPIKRCLAYLLKQELNTESAYHLFFIVPTLRDKALEMPSVIKALCGLLPNLVTELNFIMCVKVLRAIEAVPVKVIDKPAVERVVNRLVFILERNMTELIISMHEFGLLVRCKLVYTFIAREKWDNLLSENIALSLAKNKDVFILGQMLWHLTKHGISLEPAMVKFVDLILNTPPSDKVTPKDITSMVYFACTYVNPNSILTVAKHILELVPNYKNFELKEVNYILDALKARGCDRTQLPASIVTFLYNFKHNAVAPHDLGKLFPLLKHFEIDANPIAFNLINVASTQEAGWIAQASADDLVVVLNVAMDLPDMVHGPFIGAVTARFENIIGSTAGTAIVKITFAILHLAVISHRCGKPFFVHAAIDSVPAKVASLHLRDIVLLLKAVQISAHIYPSKFLKPFAARVREILRTEPKTSLVELNSVLHGFDRVGLDTRSEFTDAWEFSYQQLVKDPQPREISDHKFVDRVLNTMITTKIVHVKLAKVLIDLIARFEDNRIPFAIASRLYNSCTKLVQIDKAFVSIEVLDKLKNSCLLNIFQSPAPVSVSLFVESAFIRHRYLGAKFDEESVAAIVIITHRVFGMRHHLVNHCINSIFEHLEAFEINPEKSEWLSENGKIRFLVDSGYITPTHVSRFAETYAKHFRKNVSCMDLSVNEELKVTE